jgi:hypothetical protein
MHNTVLFWFINNSGIGEDIIPSNALHEDDGTTVLYEDDGSTILIEDV